MSESETPAERIARKKRESDLRQNSQAKEAQWRALMAHVVGIMTILAQWSLGYKPDFKKER